MMLRPEEVNTMRILISPLNWGWGHVARCIPLIVQLQKQGNVLFVACSEAQEGVFREYLNGVVYLRHEGYPFEFRGKGQFGRDLFRTRKQLRRRLLDEEREVAHFVASFGIELVLSDHRYGFHSSVVPSIFITHQVNLPVSPLMRWVQAKHRRLMQQFSAWWIMDFSDHQLAGRLSATKDAKGMYIGPYSRFSLYEDAISKAPAGKVYIASGPEIYAGQFAEMHRNSLGENEVLISAEGKGSWRSFDAQIRAAETVVARSGYSTIMDLYFLGKKAELSPTPGQAEQVYLHSLHKGASWLSGK